MSNRGYSPQVLPPSFAEPDWSSDPFADACRRRQEAITETERAAPARAKAARAEAGKFAPLVRAAKRGALPTFPAPDEPFQLSQGVSTRDLNLCVLGLARAIRQASEGLDSPLWGPIFWARLEQLARIDAYVLKERGART